MDTFPWELRGAAGSPVYEADGCLLAGEGGELLYQCGFWGDAAPTGDSVGAEGMVGRPADGYPC